MIIGQAPHGGTKVQKRKTGKEAIKASDLMQDRLFQEE